MTALALDVRELNDYEMDAVSGGPIWFVVAAAVLLLGGCAHTKHVREADGAPGDEGAVPRG